jgi:hypothetical protein
MRRQNSEEKATIRRISANQTSCWGVAVVHHGGSLVGYKSDLLFVPEAGIPEAGIGAVILANSDQGQALIDPFMRRLLEILYDGKPEVAATVASTAARYMARRWKAAGC